MRIHQASVSKRELILVQVIGQIKILHILKIIPSYIFGKLILYTTLKERTTILSNFLFLIFSKILAHHSLFFPYWWRISQLKSALFGRYDDFKITPETQAQFLFGVQFKWLNFEMILTLQKVCNVSKKGDTTWLMSLMYKYMSVWINTKQSLLLSNEGSNGGGIRLRQEMSMCSPHKIMSFSWSNLMMTPWTHVMNIYLLILHL